MKITVRSQPDFLSGLLFIALGLGFNILSTQYAMGEAARMGPGYFPFLLGALLAVLGLVISAKSVLPSTERGKVEPLAFRPFFLVLASVALFGALLVPLGFILSGLILLFVGSAADPDFDWKKTAVVSVAVMAASYLIFIYGLGLPMDLWLGGR